MTGAARRSHRQRMKQLRRVKRSQLIRRSVAALRTAFRASLGLFAVLLVAAFLAAGLAFFLGDMGLVGGSSASLLASESVTCGLFVSRPAVAFSSL